MQKFEMKQKKGEKNSKMCRGKGHIYDPSFLFMAFVKKIMPFLGSVSLYNATSKK